MGFERCFVRPMPRRIPSSEAPRGGPSEFTPSLPDDLGLTAPPALFPPQQLVGQHRGPPLGLEVAANGGGVVVGLAGPVLEREAARGDVGQIVLEIEVE